MRNIFLLSLGLALSLPSLVHSDDSKAGKGKKDEQGNGISVSVSVPNIFGSAAHSTTVTTSASSPSTTSQNPAQSTITQSIDVSSLITSVISGSKSTPTTGGSQSQTLVGASASNTEMASNESYFSQHRTLIIVLATVLGFVGLVLIAGIAFLAYRYRRGQSPFSNRGASPIDDDEIASWRKTGADQKRRIPPEHGAAVREVNSMNMASPGWTWTASPTSIRTISACLDSPAFLTKAPNAREGLTDETVPGADPFIASPKRQSSRLSKPPPGHIRSKSRRSSLSGKSMWSINTVQRPSSDMKQKDNPTTWYDLDSEIASRQQTVRSDSTSSPETSIFDGLSAGGGLSPRPKSAPRYWEEKDIGRAIV